MNDHPAQKVRQIDHRLRHTQKRLVLYLVEHQCDQNGKREQNNQLHQRKHQRVSKKHSELAGDKNLLEIFQSYPGTFSHGVQNASAQKNIEVLKGQLQSPQRQ